ncbi:hypothetical protein JW905_17900 [bacterium]|nr:hypothetical protein [candidate division CSSED10-310 bacterium]
MPDAIFRPDDFCEVTATVCNPEWISFGPHALFVVLDVYGAYLCAPGFTDFDHYEIDLHPGAQVIQVVLGFTWPHGAGIAFGIYFHAGMTNQEMSELLGEIDSWEFGWTE